MSRTIRSVAAPAALLLLLNANAFAQSTAPAATADEEAIKLASFVTTGSRFNDRTVVDSPVPIDVLSSSDLQQNGYTELGQTLSVLVPALTFPRPSNTDGTDSIRPASLRGLGPDQTLVLVNGKRYHTSALVNLNGSIGRGSAAVDLNSLPAFALGGAEVLRDGAAAQYGSDAIAGVINLSLRRDSGVKVNTTLSEFYEGDGKVFDASVNAGAPLSDRGGFVNFTGYAKSRGSTNRSGSDLRQQYFGTNPTTGALVAPGTVANAINGMPDPREATFNRRSSVFGDPDGHERGAFFNAAVPVQGGSQLYLFGGLSARENLSFATWRRAADSTNVRAIYPDGYQPRINPHIFDASLVGGLKGRTGAWNWDVSEAWGQNTVDYYVKNTLNVTYGAASQRTFYAGKLGFNQSTTNLDLSREFNLGLPAPVKTALGAEFRWEGYKINRGDDASWNNGGVLVFDGPSQGATPGFGSQGFTGFRPVDETDSSRDTVAGYVDLSNQLTSKWLLTVAGRAERYSDAGSTVTGKIATRYELTPWLSVRSSFSNGFRAPALQQSTFTTSSLVIQTINGVTGPVEVKTFAVKDPAAVALGATPLKPEDSTNFSGGLTLTPFKNFSASVDYYNIFISDRIVLSSNFSSATVGTYLASVGYPGLSGGRYFTNAVDTRTEGYDATARYTVRIAQRDSLTFTAGYNNNKGTVTRTKATPANVLALSGGTPIFDRQNTLRFERGTPRDKVSASVTYNVAKRLNFLVRTTRYGENLAAGTTTATDQLLSAKWLTDVEATWNVTPRFSTTIGANNVFDVYPDKASAVNNTSGLNLYSSFSPYGFNGGSYYTRLNVKF